MSAKIWAGNQHSVGAKLLSKELAIPRINHDLPGVVKSDRLINWGGTKLPFGEPDFVMNRPISVLKASNKLAFLHTVHDLCRTVPYFTASHDVQKHLDKGNKVVARTILNGHSGAGIKIIEKGVDIVEAKLYTIYIPKKMEFRIHIMGDEVVDIQRKIKRPDYAGEVDWSIRNHVGGFIYVRNGVREACPKDCIDQATRALEAVDLDFGAVDVLWNDKEQKAYVLEINTAPGLEGLTVKLYAEAIKKNYNEMLHL